MRVLTFACLAIAAATLFITAGCSKTSETPLPALAGEGPISILDSEDSTILEVLERALEPWEGDLDDMVKRRFIRVRVRPVCL